MHNRDPYNLDRYLRAQDRGCAYQWALYELRCGKKKSHWIWFVMPRLTGSSRMSQYYGLGNRWAARAYLRHPVLGPRLLRCVEAVLACRNTMLQIFGAVDAAKLRQTAELFASVDGGPLFLHLLCKL